MPLEVLSGIDPSAPLRRGFVLLGWLILALGAVPPVPAASPSCDTTTVLTLVGVDTRGGAVLWRFRDPDGEAFLADLRPRGPSSELAGGWAPLERAIRGGSSSPGPVLGVEDCGEECARVREWNGREWTALGPEIGIGRAATLHPTRDEAGTPWLVVHRSGEAEGVVDVVAYRLVVDRWELVGTGPAMAIGSPGAAPARGASGAVTSGTLLFEGGDDGSGGVSRWLETVPGRGRGQLVSLDGPRVAAVGFDGRIFLSDDGGEEWSEVEGAAPTGEAGGRVELPDGYRGVPLEVAVVLDDGDGGTVAIRRLEESGFTDRARVPAGLLTETGIRLPWSHFVRFEDGEWILVTGCVSTRSGPAIALRRLRDGTLEPPVLVALHPAAGR